MSFEDDFKDAELRALVENNAQDVFNTLNDLDNQASLHASRWIWELLQNARDATPLLSPLRVCASFASMEVVFQHNGVPFSESQVAHLIHHGSTKAQEEGLVGRFGTGFLSSHIISKIPHVSGQLNDGRRFAFVLDRTGSTPHELTLSMERSSKEFVASVSEVSTEALDYSTRFVYPLTPSVVQIAYQGVESLESYAPYVLSFNDEIGSIEIVQGDERKIYRRQSAIALGAGVRVIPVDIQMTSGECLSASHVACVDNGAVTVAILAKGVGDSHLIDFGVAVPKLFMAFPLFGTERIGFPGVVNSRQFCPKKDRDGLYLGQEPTEYNLANKALVEQACPLLLTLLQRCASLDWKGIERLCHIGKLESVRGVDDAWLQSLVKNAIVEPIRASSVLRTCGDHLIAPSKGQIPLGSSAVSSAELWRLLHDLADSGEVLVEEATAASWERNVRGWATVVGLVPELMQEAITPEKCARTLAGFGSLNQLREALQLGCDPVGWCNRLFYFLIQAGQTTLFDTLAILPDQKGDFHTRRELSLDAGIDEALKDIAELLDLPIRSQLLHEEVASGPMSKLLQERKQAEVLAEITRQLRMQAQKDEQIVGFRTGNIQLFAWILGNGSIESLEAFPAITQHCDDDDGAQARTISLSRDTDEHTIPLSPPELWPEGARAFSDLFPSRHVLSSAYYAECPHERLWVGTAKRGLLRLSPIYEVTDDVQDFVPDGSLTDDATHKSTNPLATTQIAFLREKNVGLMDSARKSKSKCLLLLRFLASWLIRHDNSWNEHPDVACECGKPHKCWRAGWIVPLRKNKWVYLDKNCSDKISVDSLAKLLKDETDAVNLLSEQEGPAFLAELGVSTGDFLMRVVTSDEQSRVTLSKSFIQIVQATGGDIQQVTDLALEIAAHPETISELRDRAATRRMVKRNQDVGKAVEQAIEAVLGTGRGLTVKRAPIGSDYSVEPENDYVDETGREVLLEVSTPHVQFLIEVKATVGDSIRMTDTQGKKAKSMPACYALCVVALSTHEEGVNATTVRAKAKFVFDIGKRIKPLVDALESIELSKNGALTTTGDIELEMQDQVVKFKVGREVWESGVGFEDAVRRFGGRVAANSFRPDGVQPDLTADLAQSDGQMSGSSSSTVDASTATERPSP